MADLRSSSSCEPHFIQMARLPRAPFGEQTDLNDGLPPWILGAFRRWDSWKKSFGGYKSCLNAHPSSPLA